MDAKKIIDRINKMKNPKIIIIDEATDTIISNPTKYELMKTTIKKRQRKSGI
jgi:hypothetical protein